MFDVVCQSLIVLYCWILMDGVDNVGWCWRIVLNSVG